MKYCTLFCLFNSIFLRFHYCFYMDKWQVEFTGSYRWAGLKSLGFGQIDGPVKRKAIQCVLGNEETQFLKENFKIVIVMYKNNFQSWAIFRRGPFSVNSCHLWYALKHHCNRKKVIAIVNIYFCLDLVWPM